MEKNKLKQLIKETLLSKTINESQQLHDFYRSFGLKPFNTPSKTAGILGGLQSYKYFVDYSGKLYNGPYMLKYTGKERSINLFDKINLETGKTEEKNFIVQRGNLAKLRPTFLGSWKFAPTINESKKSCSCGCNKCDKDAPLLNESLKHTYPISEQFRSIIDAKKPLKDELKRIGDIKLIREARILFDKGILELKGKDKELFTETNIGKYKIEKGKIILEYGYGRGDDEEIDNEKYHGSGFNSGYNVHGGGGAEKSSNPELFKDTQNELKKFNKDIEISEDDYGNVKITSPIIGELRKTVQDIIDICKKYNLIPQTDFFDEKIYDDYALEDTLTEEGLDFKWNNI